MKIINTGDTLMLSCKLRAQGCTWWISVPSYRSRTDLSFASSLHRGRWVTSQGAVGAVGAPCRCCWLMPRGAEDWGPPTSIRCNQRSPLSALHSLSRECSKSLKRNKCRDFSCLHAHTRARSLTHTDTIKDQ